MEQPDCMQSRRFHRALSASTLVSMVKDDDVHDANDGVRPATTPRDIDKALDRAEKGLTRLDAMHEVGSHASGHERLKQAAASSALLSSVWRQPPAQRLRFNPLPTTETTHGLMPWTLRTIHGDETPAFHGDKRDGLRFIDISSTEISLYQRLLYANGARSATSTSAAEEGAVDPSNRRILLVLQGMDSSGKGGIVKHVFRQGNPMGIHYHGFGAPSEEELVHDFLWRIRRELPKPGWIAIFDRSHYEDVVMPQVWDTASQETIRERYERINAFEADLAHSGCVIIKIFLTISKDEQRSHFLARLEDPTKRWKFAMSDLEARDRWEDYMAAWQRTFGLTSTSAAPWYVIPADNRWYSRAVVSELLRTTLAGLQLQWPPLAADIDLDEAKRRLRAE